MAKLETTTRKVIIAKEAVAVGDSFSLSVLKSWHGGAAAYVLSRQGAQKLLEQTVKVADPVDQVIFDPMSKISRTLHRLQLVPAVAIQMQFFDSQEQSDAFVSTVGRQETMSKLIRHGLGIDLQRMMKRLYSSLARRLQAANPVNIYRQIPFADEAVAVAGQK